MAQAAVVDVGNQIHQHQPHHRQNYLRADKVVNIPLEAVIPGGVTGGEQHDQPVSQHKDQRADKAIGKFAAFLFFERDFLKKPANVAKGQIEKLGKRHLRYSPLSER